MALHIDSEPEQQQAELKAMIQVGLDQYERGETHLLTRERFEEITRRAIEQAKAGQRAKDAVKP